MELYWWPKLKVPNGWIHDEEQSFAMSSNVILPKGKTFQNAPSVIYARAFYNKDQKKLGSLEAFYKDDLDAMRKHAPDLELRALSPGLRDAAGQSLPSFDSHYNGITYEEICYASEGEYRLIFVFSANSKEAFDRSVATFRSVISAYK